jgi:hypothetical protein
MTTGRRQSMRVYLLSLIAGLGLAVGSAQAQPWTTYPLPPYNAPGMSPNYYLAHQRFLASPSDYRTFSGMRRGADVDYLTAYGLGVYYRQPAYQYERITPYGYESSGYVPGYGSSLRTPGSYERSDVPGYPYGYVVPRVPPAPR